MDKAFRWASITFSVEERIWITNHAARSVTVRGLGSGSQCLNRASRSIFHNSYCIQNQNSGLQPWVLRRQLRPRITLKRAYQLEIVEISHIGGFSSQNRIFHSNGDNFASRMNFVASPKVLTSLSSRLSDAQKIRSIRPLGAKCEHVIDWID